MAHRAIRGFVLCAAAGAALAAALPAGHAALQEEGDAVVLVLKSGKKVNCTLLYRDDSTVKVRVGASEMSLPSSMVVSVEKVASAEPSPAPAPAPDAPAGPAPTSGGVSPPRGAAAAGAPKGASLIMKDGRVLEGFVVGREKGRYWFVPGPAVSIDEGDVEEAIGNLEPSSGGARGLALSGDKGADAKAMVEEIGCGVRARVDAAFAVLKGLGKDAVPALVAGLKSPSVEARDLCIEILTNLHAPEAVDPLLSLLRNDKDARIRCSVAGRLGQWDPPGARRAILDAVWQDRDPSVKTTGLLALEKTAGPEEVSALIDLMTILPSDSDARGSLFRVLKAATGEKMAPDAELWMTWWNEKGREKTGELAEAAQRERYRREQASRFGAGPEEEKPAAVEPPPEVLKTEETPAEGGTPPEGPK